MDKLYNVLRRKQGQALIKALIISLLVSIVLLFFIDISYLPYLIILSLVLMVIQLFTGRWHRIGKILFSVKDDLSESEQQILLNSVSFYRTLNEEEKSVFRKRVQLFLASVPIKPIDCILNRMDHLLLAAGAVIPVFRLPLWEYPLSVVLVYPGAFGDDFSTREEEADYEGMVLNYDTMILSLQALREGFTHPHDHHNVVIHEFVHKLDQADGNIDGIPAALLHQRKQLQEWKSIMKLEKESILADHSDIDPYAASQEAEFFAVVSEYFFEDPQTMAIKHPRLYRLLAEVYRQDFLTDVKDTFRKIVRQKPKKYALTTRKNNK